MQYPLPQTPSSQVHGSCYRKLPAKVVFEASTQHHLKQALPTAAITPLSQSWLHSGREREEALCVTHEFELQGLLCLLTKFFTAFIQACSDSRIFLGVKFLC